MYPFNRGLLLLGLLPFSLPGGGDLGICTYHWVPPQVPPVVQIQWLETLYRRWRMIAILLFVYGISLWAVCCKLQGVGSLPLEAYNRENVTTETVKEEARDKRGRLCIHL